MVKRFITYTGVTKAWRNKYGYKEKNSWAYKYAREIMEGIIITKEYNHGRVINMRERILILDSFFCFKIRHKKKRSLILFSVIS